MPADSAISTRTRIGSPQPATAGSTTTTARLASMPPSVSSAAIRSRTLSRVAADDRRLPRASRRRGVDHQPGVLQSAEDDDRQQDRHEHERHDQDGLDGREAALGASEPGERASARQQLGYQFADALGQPGVPGHDRRGQDDQDDAGADDVLQRRQARLARAAGAHRGGAEALPSRACTLRSTSVTPPYSRPRVEMNMGTTISSRNSGR